MIVVSIDPAPSKPAVVFDGSFTRKTACELPAFCAELSSNAALLCWDAPLTGPPQVGGNTFGASYSQRIIERFFSRTSTGFKAPPGISVLPYSGCPHWSITRASLGLPRVGLYDNEDTPFRLVSGNNFERSSGQWVVESHPAVAIWLWCRDKTESSENDTWVYKGSKPSRTIEELWAKLSAKWIEANIAEIKDTIGRMDVPADDDELDAVTGWVLGVLLAHNHPSVTVLGNEKTGAIVLPNSPLLLENFAEFCQAKDNAI